MAVAGLDKQAAPASSPADSSEAVRKQVTVLFCDIVDYTHRSSSMDPEQLSDDVQEFQRICAPIAERYQGHISNYLGDGIMVLFGHPHASEFSPEWAVRAALEMVEAVKRTNKSPRWKNRPPLAIRIGIATGLVVVGDRAGKQRNQDELIFGNAPNLAARLQAVAEPNTVVAALRTRKLIGLAFKSKNLGKFELKGFNHPVSAWQILTERKLQKRPGNILRRNIARFISRRNELRVLNQNFDSARFGFSRFVHIQGDPGIGKTRLLRTFEKSIMQHEIHRIRISCSPYHRNSFLRPVNDECLRWLRVTESDDLETKRASVGWAMSILRLNDVDQYLLFTDLMNIPPPAGLAVIEMSSHEKRNRIITALVEIVHKISKNRPTLLVAEDLHWADPSTLEFVSRLMQRSSEERLLGLITSRSHFVAPWKQLDSLTDMQLEGLTQSESGRLVESVFADHYLPEGLKQSIVRKSDGVPLFLEESCLNAINLLQRADDNHRVLSGYDVPETLQDSLNARLDQLGSCKPLAQLASTFGESFTYAAITEIARRNQIECEDNLVALIEDNILVLNEDAAVDRYRFRHAMFQEAAYLSLLIRTRQRYHQQIADWFLQQDADFAEKYPEVIAHHFSKTEQTARAIGLWNKAGERAIAKSAFLEAIEHLQQGLSLVGTLDPGTEKSQLELALLLNLGVSLTARAGYYGFEVTRTYERAVELARQIGDDNLEWTALYGYWRCQISQAEYAAGIRIGSRLNALSQKIGEPMLELTTCGIKAMSRLVDGKLDKADELTARSVSLYASVEDKTVGQKFGQDPYVTIQGLGAVAQLLRGKTVDSLESISRSLNVARQIGHAYTIAEALKLASMYQQISRNMEQLKLHCSEAIEISNRYGFEGVLATHEIFLAFADVVTKRDESRIDVIIENLVLYERKYGLLFLPYFKTILGEAYLQLGRYEEAFSTSEIILEDIEMSGENWVLPVALCIKSEAAVRGDLTELQHAKAWYCQSLETAAQQDARLMMGRTLQAHSFFNLEQELVAKYKELSRHDDQSLLMTNLDYLTQRH